MRRLALVLGVLAGCGGPYRLSQPGERVDMGIYTVDPQGLWSMSNNRIWHTWTVDGYALEQVSFVNGLQDGQALYPRLQQRENSPRFRSSMSPQEVSDFIKTSVELLWRTKKVKMTEPKPQPFGSLPGYRIDFEYPDWAELDIQGLVVFTIHRGRLYLISYWGAKEYYFAKYRELVEQVIASVLMGG